MNPVVDQLYGLTDPLPRSGRHAGHVKIPHSSDTSAYGFIPVPIAVVGGRAGSTVLILGGSYGDETESQIAAVRLVQSLDPAAMTGRVIVLPMANAPAARSGTRNSPIDGRNLNRSFPGDVLGTPTSIIADYIERQLMPESDIVVDLHSDGRSLRYIPSVTLMAHAEPEIRARRLAAALAFGGPNVLLFHSFEDRNSSGAARRAGTVRIATEIGGSDPVADTVAGLTRLLRWAGVLGGAATASERPALQVVRQDQDFVFALHDGVFEPARGLGEAVAAGDVAGYLHDPSQPFRAPFPVVFPKAGQVVCTRGAGPAARGDCLMHLAVPADADLEAEYEAASRLRWLPAAPADGEPRRSATHRKRPSA